MKTKKKKKMDNIKDRKKKKIMNGRRRVTLYRSVLVRDLLVMQANLA